MDFCRYCQHTIRWDGRLGAYVHNYTGMVVCLAKTLAEPIGA